MPVFCIILEAPISGDHYYTKNTYEEVIDLINFAKEKGQRIKKITQQKEKSKKGKK